MWLALWAYGWKWRFDRFLTFCECDVRQLPLHGECHLCALFILEQRSVSPRILSRTNRVRELTNLKNLHCNFMYSFSSMFSLRSVCFVVAVAADCSSPYRDPVLVISFHTPRHIIWRHALSFALTLLCYWFIVTVAQLRALIVNSAKQVYIMSLILCFTV